MPDDSGLVLELSFPAAVRAEPFSGRVIIFLSDRVYEEAPEPIRRGFMSRQPVLYSEVRDWRPDTPLVLNSAEGYPCDMSHLAPGRYRIQAAMHVNPDLPHCGTAEGNLCSSAATITLPRTADEPLKLVLDKVRHKNKLPLPKGIERVELRSKLLSEFTGRDIFMRAIVILPEEFEPDGKDRYPAIYDVPGFGGNALNAATMTKMMGESEVPFVRIGLDPTCGWGHHVFADSANNGPYGQALVEEFIPHLEKKYRLLADPRGRFVTGHSSGGWSSLWLQVIYPDFFGGVWSGSPDPVDFHDFTGINLYDPKVNFLYLPNGKPRPFMRDSGRVKMHLRDFVGGELAVGPGGQVQSFEAVFSPCGKDGKPMPVFDRKTGEIHRDVVEAWKAYDIREHLEKNWKTLGPKLEGKITIVVGTEDNFYLDQSVRLLRDSLKKLGSDAKIVFVPRTDHFSVIFSQPYRAMLRQMTRKYLESCGDKAEVKSPSQGGKPSAMPPPSDSTTASPRDIDVRKHSLRCGGS